MKNLFVYEKYETFQDIARTIFKEDFFHTLLHPEKGRKSLHEMYNVFCNEQFTQIHTTEMPEDGDRNDYIPNFSKTFTIRHNYDSTYLLQWQAPGGSGKTQQTLIFALMLFFSKYQLRTVFSVSENAIVEEIEQRLAEQILPQLHPEYQRQISVGSLKGWEKLYRDVFHGRPCLQAEELDFSVDNSYEIYHLKYEQCPTCPFAIKEGCPLITKIILATQSDILITNHHVLLKTRQSFTGIGESSLKRSSTTTLLLDRLLVIDESERFTELCFKEGYLDLSRSTISLLEDKYSHPEGTNEWLENNEKKWREKLNPDTLNRIRKDDFSLANTLEKLRDNQGRGDLYSRTSEFLRHLKTFVRRMDDFADVCSIDQHSWQVNFFQDAENSEEVKEKLIDLFVEAYFLNQNPFMKYRLILYAFDEQIKKAVELIRSMGEYTNFVLRDFIRTVEKYHDGEIENEEQQKFTKIDEFFADKDSLKEGEWRKYLRQGKQQIKQMFSDYNQVREFWLTKIRLVSRYNPNTNAQYNHYDAGLLFPSRMYGAFRRLFLKSPYICLMSATGLSNTPQNEYMNNTLKRVLKYCVDNPQNQQSIYHTCQNDTRSGGAIHLVEVKTSRDSNNGLHAPDFPFDKRHAHTTEEEKQSVQAKIREILLLEDIVSSELLLPHYVVKRNIGEIDFQGSCGVFVGSNKYMTWIKEFFEQTSLKNVVITRSEIALRLLSDSDVDFSELFNEKRIFIADSQDSTFQMEIGYTDTQKISDYALNFHQLFCRNAQQQRCMYIGLWQGNYRGVNLVLQNPQRSALKRQHWLFYLTYGELSRNLLYDHFRPSKGISPHDSNLQQIFQEFTLVDFLREKDQLICRSHRYPNEHSFLFLHDCRELTCFEKSAKGAWLLEDYLKEHKESFSERFCTYYIEPLLNKSIEHSCQLEITRKDTKFENDFVKRCQQLVQSEDNLRTFHDKIYCKSKPDIEKLRELFLDIIQYARCFSNEELGFIIPHDNAKAVKFTDTFKQHRTRFLQQWENKLTEEEMKSCKNRIFKSNNSPLFQRESAWKRNFKSI